MLVIEDVYLCGPRAADREADNPSLLQIFILQPSGKPATTQPHAIGTCEGWQPLSLWTPTPCGQDPPNRFPQIYGFMSTFLPLATIALILRFVPRLKFSYIGYGDIASSIA